VTITGVRGRGDVPPTDFPVKIVARGMLEGDDGWGGTTHYDWDGTTLDWGGTTHIVMREVRSLDVESLPDRPNHKIVVHTTRSELGRLADVGRLVKHKRLRGASIVVQVESDPT
jgi:hypothetical protein